MILQDEMLRSIKDKFIVHSDYYMFNPSLARVSLAETTLTLKADVEENMLKPIYCARLDIAH